MIPALEFSDGAHCTWKHGDAAGESQIEPRPATRHVFVMLVGTS
jgi:hypothetical protein